MVSGLLTLQGRVGAGGKGWVRRFVSELVFWIVVFCWNRRWNVIKSLFFSFIFRNFNLTGLGRSLGSDVRIFFVDFKGSFRWRISFERIGFGFLERRFYSRSRSLFFSRRLCLVSNSQRFFRAWLESSLVAGRQVFGVVGVFREAGRGRRFRCRISVGRQFRSFYFFIWRIILGRFRAVGVGFGRRMLSIQSVGDSGNQGFYF